MVWKAEPSSGQAEPQPRSRELLGRSAKEPVRDLDEYKVDRAVQDFYDKVSVFGELDIELDVEDRILWCAMDPSHRPSVTMGLVQEGRSLQGAVKDLFQQGAVTQDQPFDYMVWTSKIPGIFNLGGDLRLFVDLIRDGNKAGLIDYATACIDVVYGNVSNLDLPLTTVALVEGQALGGGFEKALSCQFMIAERSAKFGLPEVFFGLYPGMGAYSLLARKLGAAQAKRMVRSGKVFSAEELYELGLVDVLVEDGNGRVAVLDFTSTYQTRRETLRGLHGLERSYCPVTYEELIDVAMMWVESAVRLDEANIRRMTRLATAQDRNRPVAE